MLKYVYIRMVMHIYIYVILLYYIVLYIHYTIFIPYYTIFACHVHAFRHITDHPLFASWQSMHSFFIQMSHQSFALDCTVKT